MVIFTLIVSMVLVLVLVNKKVNIGYSLIAGSVVLALLNGRGILYILNVFRYTLTEYAAISLALTIGLITVLGHLMDKYLILDRMIVSLEKMLRSTKATILIAPALIGTLLVAGGALMSCPVVDSLGKKLDIPNSKRVAINLIFRHALFFIFPLSPSLILASQIGEFSMWDFIKLMSPMAIAMYVLGYVLYLKDYKETAIEKTKVTAYLKGVYEFLLYASPILVSIVGVVIFDLPFYISLVFGILLSIGINLYDKRKDDKFNINEKIYITVFKGIKFPMVIAILGIMAFKNTVNGIDEIFVVLNSLLEMGVPMELLIIAGCLIISFPLASTQPSIAILFPMILPLAPDYDTRLLYAMLIYTTAFISYYTSPLHLCQVLTLEYFEVKIRDLYKHYKYILPLVYLVMVVIYVVNVWGIRL